MESKVKTPFKVKIWTSSHGLESHHFPQSLETVFQESSKLKQIQIDAKGGRQINEEFVAEYLKDFRKVKELGEPQITVLLMGDNNIRKFAKKGAFKVFKFTKEIIKAHEGTCHPLLVLGLMPSPKTHHSTISIAEYLDDILQETIFKLHKDSSGRFFAFVCTTSFFTNQDGFILNKKYFSRDGIHLNKDGALALASNIVENARLLAETVWDYAD